MSVGCRVLNAAHAPPSFPPHQLARLRAEHEEEMRRDPSLGRVPIEKYEVCAVGGRGRGEGGVAYGQYSHARWLIVLALCRTGGTHAVATRLQHALCKSEVAHRSMDKHRTLRGTSARLRLSMRVC